MADMPDDRPQASESNLEPRIYAIVGGKKFPRPGLETFFASGDAASTGSGAASQPRSGCSCYPVGGVICTCNKQCSCVSHPSCSHSSGGGGGYRVTGCRCAPVH